MGRPPVKPNIEPLLPPSDLDAAARAVRFLSIDAIEKAKSGHPGAPMGQAQIAVELFVNQLRHYPLEPEWPGRDRFVLSCGHASMLLYSVLHLAGYDVSIDDIRQFRQWGSKTPGHPEYRYTPGVETTTGPLGQGVGNAVGMALASKMAEARLGSLGHLARYDVFCLCSDGDVMEGVASEAASLAGHLGLDNLIVIYDDNRITIDGSTELAFSEDVGQRFAAQGWAVQHIDGHDSAAIQRAILEARQATKPALIVARTRIGFGSPGKEGKSSSHGSPLGVTETEKTKTQAGWTSGAFELPAEGRQAFEQRMPLWKADYEEWQRQVAALTDEDRARLDAVLYPKVPSNLVQALVHATENKTGATRVHAGKIEQKVAELVPALIGGSADLASSVKTNIEGSADVEKGAFSGRNLHFGIREHGMGAILNGLALSGFFIPFGSTFLIFGDYMRPPMRLAALMKQRVIYVLTHDSIFLGEDGPTHQPIEQLWTMRMVPNLHVFRPADALESAVAWAYAVQRSSGPTVLALTRQDVPPLERAHGFDPEEVLRGAYVVVDPSEPELVVIATGSEVHVAITAVRELEREGRRIRVVSMPCVQAFLALPQVEQEKILPPGVRRASFELGVTFPWRALTGADGFEIGIDHFGASAPAERLAEEFGVTASQVAARLRRELGA